MVLGGLFHLRITIIHTILTISFKLAGALIPNPKTAIRIATMNASTASIFHADRPASFTRSHNGGLERRPPGARFPFLIVILSRSKISVF